MLILKTYASVYSNVRIITQVNKGQSKARNKGISQATGEYIYFLDSDDYIMPKTIEKLVTKMKDNQLDLIRFSAEPFSKYEFFRINKKQYDFQDYFLSDKIYTKSNFLKKNLKAFSPSPVLYMMKRELLTKNKINFKPDIIHEDQLFTLEVFLNAETIMYDPTPYYKRRYRLNSTMTSNTPEALRKSFDSTCQIFKEMRDLLRSYTNKDEQRLIKNRKREITAMLIYNNTEKNYKSEKIRELNGISRIDCFYFILKKSVKKIIYPFLNRVKS